MNNPLFQTEPCQNYITCLEKLEEKQRECRDDTIQRRQLRATLTGEDEDDDDEDEPQKCSKKQNHELHDELTALHLRKTEVIRDCLKKNLEHAVINGTEESVSLSVLYNLCTLSRHCEDGANDVNYIALIEEFGSDSYC